MNLLFSRLSKTERDGKKKKKRWIVVGTEVPNALYPKLIIFFCSSLSASPHSLSSHVFFFLHVHFHPVNFSLSFYSFPSIFTFPDTSAGKVEGRVLIPGRLPLATDHLPLCCQCVLRQSNKHWHQFWQLPPPSPPLKQREGGAFFCLIISCDWGTSTPPLYNFTAPSAI